MLHVQPDAADARRVPIGQRRDSRRACRGHHERGDHARAAACIGRRDAGDEPRRLDVGREHGARHSAGLAMTFPGGGGGGRGGGGGGGGAGGGAAGARPTSSTSSTACSTGARVHEEREPDRQSTGRSNRSCRFSSEAGDVRAAPAPSRRSATRSRGPSGRTSTSCIRTSPNSQGMAPFLKAHNVPVILGNVLTMPQNEDRFHAYTYQAAGRPREGGRAVRVLERRLRATCD